MLCAGNDVESQLGAFACKKDLIVFGKARAQDVFVSGATVRLFGLQGFMNVVEGLRIWPKCEAAQITSRK